MVVILNLIDPESGLLAKLQKILCNDALAEGLVPSVGKSHIVHCRGADKSLAQPTSRYILFDGDNISFDASLVIYTNNTNIPPIMIINGIYENQNLLSL